MSYSMEKYDPFLVPVPSYGMNMNIDEEALPSSYASSLVNFIPYPSGSLTLRNGTQNQEQYAGKKVLYVIPYMKENGEEDYLTVCQNNDPEKCDLFSHNMLLVTFNATSRMRGFNCMGKLLLCTGVDPVLVFDDVNVEVKPLEQRVQSSLQAQHNLFSVIGNYPGVHLNDHVYALKNNVRYTVTPDAHAKNLFDLRDEDGNQPDISQNKDVTFVVYPPFSSFCIVIGNRLWFTGEGGTSRAFKQKAQAMLVRYSHELNKLNGFLNPQTGLMDAILLDNISSVPDSIDRIESYRNFTVFFGKKQIYLYNGYYPEKPDFGLAKVISFGLYHPDLLKKIGDDIIFVSYGGIKKIANVIGTSSSSSNVSIDVSIEDVNGLDPFINDIQRSMTDEYYLLCASAFYQDKNQVMFKIGRNETLVFSAINERYVPYLYSGDFTYSYSLSEGRSCVYLAYRDSVLCYQEEQESETDALFGKISFIWKTPTRHFDVKTFTSQHVVLNAECDPQFEEGLKDGSCSLSMDIDGVNGRNFSFLKTLNLQSSGDFLSGFDVKRINNYGVLPSVEFKQRLSISFNKANITVQGESASGRIKIKNISLRGIFSHGY